MSNYLKLMRIYEEQNDLAWFIADSVLLASVSSTVSEITDKEVKAIVEEALDKATELMKTR
jgi:ATP-dependent Zn protease